MTAGLRAGFALADITPHQPTILSGFASRTGLATGTLDPLQARVLMLAEGDAKVALVALDLIGVPDGLTEIVRAAIGPDCPALIVAATHTHAGPPVLARAMLGKPPAGYLPLLVQQIAQSITAAASDLRIASIERRSAVTSGIAHNRRDPSGPVDHSADVVTLRREGAPAIIWVNFACHPVVLGPDNLSYSADFPGATRQRIEAATGAQVVYTTGCAGEINLGHSALDSIRKIGMDKRTPAEANRIGQRLGDAVVAALQSPVEPAVSGRTLLSRSHHVPARFMPPDAATRAELQASAGRKLSDASLSSGERIMAEIDLNWLAQPTSDVADLPVSILMIGSLKALFLPGEIFCETAMSIKQRHPGAIVVGYAGANPGYIPPSGARGGYEVGVAWRPYGAPGPFTPGMAEELADAALALLA